MIDCDRIETFIGFGSANAPVVFVGMEEGQLSEDTLDTDLLTRSKFERVMDLHAAQVSLAGPQKYFGEKPKCQRMWRPMCHLMLRRRTEEPLDVRKRSRYQADELGRSWDQSLLCELMPYPSPKTKRWLYGRFGRFANREDYCRTLLSERLGLLNSLFVNIRRELIVFYGKHAWQHYERLLSAVVWRGDDRFRIGDFQSTRFMLVPHFSREEFNTENQLDEFARIALSG